MTTLASLDPDCLAHVLTYLPTCRQRAKLVMAGCEGAFSQRVLISPANRDLTVYIDDLASYYYLCLMQRLAQANHQRVCSHPHRLLITARDCLGHDSVNASHASTCLYHILLHHAHNVVSLTINLNSCKKSHMWFDNQLGLIRRCQNVSIPHLTHLSLNFGNTNLAYIQSWLWSCWTICPKDQLLQLEIMARRVTIPKEEDDYLVLPFLPQLERLVLNMPDLQVIMTVPQSLHQVYFPHLTHVELNRATMLDFCYDDKLSQPNIREYCLQLNDMTLTSLSFIGSLTSCHNITAAERWFLAHHSDEYSEPWDTQLVDPFNQNFFQTCAAQIEDADKIHLDKAGYESLATYRCMSVDIGYMADYASLRRVFLFARHLTTLDLSWCRFGKSGQTNGELLSFISSSLTCLNLDNITSLQCDLSCVRRLTQLQHLSLERTPIQLYHHNDGPPFNHPFDHCLMADDALPVTLNYLNLNYTIVYSKHDDSTRTMLSQVLCRLTQLVTLKLNGYSDLFTMSQLTTQILGCQATLTTLKINNSGVWRPDIDLSGLSAFQSLQKLDMGGVRGVWRCDVFERFQTIIDGTHIIELDQIWTRPLRTLVLPSLPLTSQCLTCEPWFLNARAHGTKIRFNQELLFNFSPRYNGSLFELVTDRS